MRRVSVGGTEVFREPWNLFGSRCVLSLRLDSILNTNEAMRIVTQDPTQPMFDKLLTIVDGWKNLLFKNSRVELLAEKREQICLPCPHKTAYTCGLCGCPLKAKLRAVDARCPDNRW